MGVKIRTLIRQQWAGLIALFLVLSGGTALATHPGGANTISSGDIINDEVRTQDIAAGHVTSQDIGTGEVLSEDIGNSQVALNDLAANSVNSGKIVEGGVQGSDVLDNELTGADVNDNSLKGADIDEGSLNGALIPGIATSGLVKSSGVVTADDPNPPGEFDDTDVPLLTAGPFTVTGHCLQDPGPSGVVNADVKIVSSAGPWSVDSDADNGEDESTDTPAGLTFRHLAEAPFTTAKVIDAGDYAAAAPNKLLAGEVFAGVNLMSTDCVFGVTGIG